MRWKNKETIEEPENFGFHLPFAYLDRVCPLVIKSNYCSLPRAGGLDEQDPRFLDDLDTYRWLKEWADQEVKGGSGQATGQGLSFDEL